MRIWIDTIELKLLLEKKRQYIGNTYVGNISYILSGLIAVCSSYAVENQIIIDLIWIFGAILVVAGLKGVYHVAVHNYTHETLYKDIEALDKVTHPFSIVVIKDTYHEFPNHFLLYRDHKWSCNFFLNYRTQSQEDKNIAAIKARLSQELHIPEKDISLTKMGQVIQEKYAVKEEKKKVYDHSYYEAKIATFPKGLQGHDFVLDGKEFVWMTLEEMKNNKDIQEKNLDVVNQVSSFIL